MGGFMLPSARQGLHVSMRMASAHTHRVTLGHPKLLRVKLPEQCSTYRI